MDIHASIRAFLQQQSIAPAKEKELITKAGVVPFLRNPLRFYLMKPMARHPSLPPPKLQIGKGTRMMQVGGEWVDISPSLTLPPIPAFAGTRGDIETLAETALREGIEELGLVLENIRRLFDMGAYAFASARTGKEKQMQLFAAEMVSEEFSDDVAETTAQRAWLTPEQVSAQVRGDHINILLDIKDKLLQV